MDHRLLLGELDAQDRRPRQNGLGADLSDTATDLYPIEPFKPVSMCFFSSRSDSDFRESIFEVLGCYFNVESPIWVGNHVLIRLCLTGPFTIYFVNFTRPASDCCPVVEVTCK